VPRLSLPQLRDSDGNTARAITGQRPLYDAVQQKFGPATVWDRTKLQAGDHFDGPAIIEQFDSTTIALPDQRVSVEANGTLIIEERAQV